MSELRQKLADLSRDEKKALFDLVRKKKEAAAPAPIERRGEAGGPFPLSFPQERLWFIEQLFPGMPTYNIAAIFRLSGLLDVAALSRAVDEIVRRHAVLRTVFAEDDGQPVQRLLPPRPVPFPLIDLTALPPLPAAARDAESLRLVHGESVVPFDLAAGPLLRFRLLRLGEREHLAFFAMHHIVTDGWSMGVFYREVAVLYGAFSAGLPSPLPEIPVQYVDYARWQREKLQGAALEDGLAFWRRELAGVPVLELPTDRRRPAIRSGAGSSVAATFSSNLRTGLSALLQTGRSTLYMGLLAAFSALLHRLTGQDGFAVGSPVANRNPPEISDLIGFFVNTVALRADLSGDPPFRELLARVRRTVMSAFQHQEIPFEKIVEALQPERFLSHTPLFQVMLSLTHATPGETVLDGLVLESVPTGSSTSKFDLGLILTEAPGGLALHLEYDLDLFDAATAGRLARHLETLLAGALAAPDEPVSSLPLLTAAERDHLLLGWNRTARPYPREATIHGLFAEQAEKTPQAVALVADESVWAYRDLAVAAGRLARRLRRLGVGPEVPVAVLVERSPEMVAALLGILAAGGFFVPLDPGHPPERLAALLARTGTRLVVTQERWLNVLPEGVTAVSVDRDLLETGEPEGESSGLPADLGEPESLAYVMFTSGSTGEPKGVAITHRNIVRLVRGVSYADMGPGEVWAQLAPAAFDGSTLEIWGPLLNGGTLAVAPPRLPSLAELAGFLARHRVTFLLLTAGLFHQMAEEQPEGFAPLRRVLAGGDVILPEPVRRLLTAFPGLTVVNGYGPTEGTVLTCCWEMRGPTALEAAEDSVPIGNPIANTVVYVLDPRMRPAPIGVWGELHAGGDGLARGYFGRPDLTAERFVPDPFAALHGTPGARLYRTGDLVRCHPRDPHDPHDPQGPEPRIEFLGRNDRQVKIRGFRIEPGEVEAVLVSHPQVRQAAVAVRGGGDRDGNGDKHLVAYLACAAEWSAELEGELRRHLRTRLPEPMTPSAFVALPELPLTPNGKVDRQALAAITPERRGDASAAPRTHTEEVLALLWVEVLGEERTGGRIGIDDNFFDLGGHSLVATRLVARIRSTLGVDVPLRAVFETPTVAALAALVDSLGVPVKPGHRSLAGLGPEKRSALFELLRRKSAKEKNREQIRPRRPAAGAPGAPDVPPPPLSFGQERLWFLDRLEPGHTALNMPFALRLRGRLDVAALGRALAAVTDRHEVLRTAFRESGGRPLPVISPPGHPSKTPLPVVDLAGLPERAALVRRLSGALTGTPFDLTTGPVLRACLLRLEPELHVFLLTVHHIAADGWSLGVLTRELTLLYAAFLAGRPSPLPPPALQYGDFASWQREWLQGDVLAAQLAWWRETLAGNPAPLDLPADRPRPAVQTYRGAAARLSLPAVLGSALGALSRREGGSLFMTLLAGLQILLHRLSGQDDILVGSPIAGRRLSETEGMIGFFLNTLVLRGDLSGDPSFRELLGRVRRNVLGAFTHQDIPFEALLAELQPERDLSRTPFFQVFINMLNFPDEGLSVPGLEVEVGELPAAESKFDLTLYIAEQEDEIVLRLSYNADLFDAPRMEELLAQYALLLEQAADRPEAGIESFSLRTARARAVVPDTILALAVEPPGVPVLERFAERARRHPDRPAVVDRDGTWTYGDLDAASRRLARDLVQAGVETGALQSTVAIWAHRGAALPAALLGVWRAGAAFLILDPAYPEARLAGQIARVRPQAWVALPGAGPVPDAVAAALAGRPRLEVTGRGAGAGEAVEMPERALPPGALAYIAFTSGSTGEPKGILGTHGPLSHFFAWHVRTFELGEGDRFSLLSGLAHDPLLRDVFTPLWVGGTLCIPGADDLELPGRLASWFVREAVTVAHLTPAMGQLLNAGAAAPLPTLRHAFFGGDVLTAGDVETMRRLAPAARLVNFYGATETPQAMGSRVIVEREEAVPARLPLGRGIDGVQLLVLDRVGQMTGIGELGEIVIRTPWLATGYLNDPAATAERFAPHPSPGGVGGRAYRTGDLGRYQPDGELVFAGRADTQVKIRGFRIETAEVESALVRHPAVREAAVIARGARGEGSDRFLVAFVVPADGAAMDAEELRAFLAARLPDFMVPAVWEVLDALPLTPNRKVDRRALENRPLAEASRQGSAELVAPRDEVEERIAAIWRELLDIETVGVHDSFFALGGHSLLAARLMAAVRDAYGVEIPLRTLFEKPTLAELARVVAAAGPAGGEAPPDSGIPRLPRVSGEPARFPVSFSQLREWILDCLEPGTPNYNILSNFRISGPLSVPTLAASLREIVRRHESLRTTFVAAAGGGAGSAEPLQSVAHRLDLALPVIDLAGLAGLAGLPEAAQEDELRRRMEHETRTGFNLAAGPLLRARLVRLGPADHAVLFTVHHIVTDGWSMGIFFREITLLYDAFSNGRPSPLPELPVQYGDFAVWQRGRLQGEALETQLGYWRQQLAGAPPLLELPTDRPRPPVRSGRGGKLPILLPSALIEPLRALALRQGGSLFMAVLAVFQILLARLSGQDDLAVGTFNGNRGRRELEGLIGFFINTLVLRTDLSGEPGFRELLGRVREVTLGAYAHQDIPFEKLLDVLHLERDPSRTPLFQAMLVLQNFPASRAQLSPGVTIAPLAADTHKADFDFVVWLSEVPEGLGGRVEFSADLFEEATVARMLAQFHRLLGAVAEFPEHSIWSLPLLAPEERAEILGAWSRTAEAPEGEPLLHHLVAAQAEATPEAVAVESAAGRLTYGQLAERVRALAATLRESGIGPESLVALAAERSPDLLVGMLAVLTAGGAYLPLDPAYPPERQAFMLEDSGAVLLDRLARPDRTAEPASPSPPWPPSPTPSHRPGEGGNSDSERAGAPLSRRKGGGGRGDGGEGPQGYGVEADHPAYVIYTSGSTGRPKGVLVPHRAIAAYTRTARAYYGIVPGDRVLQFASISFDTSGEEIWPALSAGATLVLRPEDMAVNIPHFVRELARLGITVLNLPTAFWHELAAGLDAEGLELPRGLRLVVIGGEEALAGRLAAWHRRVGPGVRLVNTYGPTEATIVAIHRELGPSPPAPLPAPPTPPPGEGRQEARAARAFLPSPGDGEGGAGRGAGGEGFEIPIGRPIPGARAYAVDRLFEPVPPGVRGELLLGGSGVARGYLGRPDVTAERFVPDPFSGIPGARLYRTGDLARFLADGELVFAGRADRQVKLRGYRIEPGEIEAALRLHPALHDAAVDVRGSGEGRRLVAWVVAREGTAAPAGPELRAFLRDRLPEPMVPAVFPPLPRLPLSPSGKVDRRALPDPEGERPDLATGYVEPGTSLERTIAGIFRDLLQVARVGLNDNFFDLGGHSLLVIRAHQRLREALGREISVIDLFRFPTVALLARHLAKDEEKPSFEKVQDLAERQRAAQLRQKQAMERMRRPLPGKPGKK